MTRVSEHLLDTGDPFPPLAFDTVAHGRVHLPAHFAPRPDAAGVDGWGVLLVYRAHW